MALARSGVEVSEEIQLPNLKFGTGAIEIEILSEPTVLLTVRGYAPILRARVLRSGLEYNMFIGARSLAAVLEGMKVQNGGKFRGLKLSVAKAGEEASAKYVVNPI